MKRLFFAIGLMCLASVGWAKTVHVADGDTEALRQTLVAVSEGSLASSADDPVAIHLASKGAYAVRTTKGAGNWPVSIRGHVVIYGHDAKIFNDGYFSSSHDNTSLFHVTKDGHLSMKNLKVSHAVDAIVNHGTLSLEFVRLADNLSDTNAKQIETASGSALRNYGKASIVDSVIKQNRKVWYGQSYHTVFGAAIANHGVLTINRSYFHKNYLQDGGWGVTKWPDNNWGADIGNHGKATITNTVFYAPERGWALQLVPELSPADGVVANGKGGEMQLTHVTFSVPSDASPSHQWRSVVNFGGRDSVRIRNSYLHRADLTQFVAEGHNIAALVSNEDAQAIGEAPVAVWPNPVFKLSLPSWPADLPALQPVGNSPLIGTANPVYCPMVDVRGEVRGNLCDVGAFKAAKPDGWLKNTDGLSGSWVIEGVENEKKGVLVEALADGRMQVFVFDYEGHEKYTQNWYVGSGQVDSGVFKHTMSAAARGFGVGFGSALNLGETWVDKQPLTLAFDDCLNATMLWKEKTLRLKRLTMPAGINPDCQQPSTAQSTFSSSKKIDLGISGSWYPPSNSGQGFFVEVLTDGSVQAFFFGYDQKKEQIHIAPLFTIGNGVIDGDTVRLKSYSVNQEKQLTNWGTMTLKFNSCNDAEVWFDGVDGKDYLKLKRLTSWAGNACK